ncbi:DUF4365 domain-containing protein [Frigoriglobus tundricola]|uniref:DUF4365 domain-containing protein n=1 Tax=Frigoriglobus tundricola TaxID=2774151 RepID=A0A6M5YLP8_9BACT|nr:DUF4365 domain-containing protein [Frigoriglobus tundricola]QJW95019.1 hypothetical protein FTUN_2545 [Frigoriglobus tundricola]
MTDEHRMEHLSRAYVQAVAAVAGCTCARPEQDYGSDLTLRRVERVGNAFMLVGRNLDLQLKSTTTATFTTDEVVYDLDIRAYNNLRRATHGAPLYLVLFVMPPDQGEWMAQSEDRLELRHCAYWLSLRRAPAVPNTSTVRVGIPRQNRFTPEALSRIMDAIRRQEDL